MRIEELLDVAPRRRVVLDLGGENSKLRAEKALQLLDPVATNREPAATHRPLGAERRKHEMTPSAQARPQIVEIAVPVRRIDHEMEHGAVVPEGVTTLKAIRANVDLQPLDPPGRSRTKLAASALESRGGDIGHGHVPMSALEQMGSEARGPAAEVEYRGVGGQLGPFDQLERETRLRLVPADLVGILARVDLVPMALGPLT